MPRDVNGNYTLPSGNPVVTNTLISSIWANTTLSDVATALSNSLDRTGASSGMTGQLKATDGAVGLPSISFGSEPASGLYRAGTGDFRFSVAAVDVFKFAYANPSGTVGLAAVNGTAITPTRSDATPALSQSIVPTWTGIHTFTASPIVKGDTKAYTLANSAGSSYGILGSVLGYTGAGSSTDLAVVTGGANINMYAGPAGAAGRTALSIVNNTGMLFGNSTDNQSFTFQGSGLLKAGDQAGNSLDVGWRDAPQNLQNGNYTLALSDRGKNVHHTSVSAHTWQIPDNSSIAFPIGTVIILTNTGAGLVTIGAPPTDALVWVPGGSTTSRTLTGFGVAQLIKTAATTWLLTGANLT